MFHRGEIVTECSHSNVSILKDGVLKTHPNDHFILPGIAKSWKESKDGMTWTFKLRKNAKWSNGEALTAKDFVYAWRRQVNPKTAPTQSNKYSGIKNADAIVASKKPVSSLGIKAVGKYKLVVTLERKIPYFQRKHPIARYLSTAGQ